MKQSDDIELTPCRPRSRVFVHSLLEHIELLESRLKEVDGELPQQPQQPDIQVQSEQTQSAEHVAQQSAGSWPHRNSGDHFDLPHLDSEVVVLQEDQGLSSPGDNEPHDQTPTSNATSGEDGAVLCSELADRGHLQEGCEDTAHSFLFESTRLKYDGTTGQLRYFTPLARYQLYADQISDSQGSSSGSWHLQKRLHHMIKDLTTETYNHLMTCFWTHYNEALRMIDQEAFEQDRDRDKLHYSGFLHICCLAMGFRYADKSRPDIKTLDRGNRHSTFHESARYTVETELENPRGLTTIQGLLILSDLECAVGRDRSGWMYAGVACRFSFEMGLTIDHSKSTLPQREMQSRQRLLRACVFYDRIWAIFSGHPTVIRKSDLFSTGFSLTYSKVLTSASEVSTRLAESPGETQAWDALLELMELAIKVSSHITNAASTSELNEATGKLVAAAALHGELESWQRNLPAQLRWNAENVQSSRAMFFFIHQLFHSTLIQLHSSLVEDEPDQLHQSAGKISEVSTTSSFRTVSKNVCLENAMSIVRNVDAYCTKFGMQSLIVFTPQPASVALTALLTNLAEFENSAKTTTILQQVNTLAKVLRKMSESYHTAQSVCTVLDHVLPRTKTAASSHTAELGSHNEVLQDVPQPPFQPVLQRSLSRPMHLEHWPHFQGSGMIADKDTIAATRFDNSRQTTHRGVHGEIST
ncbi:uncharacterized protein Z520_05881 [Fonsecaea multimorphosa CBS 102226]|uniref:Xylanolytic transcriptional activator regulatory domain-containing protein n=1 Tax=Fonsecaea multimorphosa CBS 102226 TaxID=1442371 RepID=A0A0D2H9N1_9EURO|nr:uncharacterized protein Z520_05881 [Fonsecaea multimorphosa CBS 102226]KIX98580.1 hypothetical protein Z520_05881 [Fonsecaea multimorphosa CBS 102226]